MSGACRASEEKVYRRRCTLKNKQSGVFIDSESRRTIGAVAGDGGAPAARPARNIFQAAAVGRNAAGSEREGGERGEKFGRGSQRRLGGLSRCTQPVRECTRAERRGPRAARAAQ